MNAQRQWKNSWMRLHYQSNVRERAYAANNMARFRREAALERKLAAAEREIERLKIIIFESDRQELINALPDIAERIEYINQIANESQELADYMTAHIDEDLIALKEKWLSP